MKRGLMIAGLVREIVGLLPVGRGEADDADDGHKGDGQRDGAGASGSGSGSGTPDGYCDVLKPLQVGLRSGGQGIQTCLKLSSQQPEFVLSAHASCVVCPGPTGPSSRDVKKKGCVAADDQIPYIFLPFPIFSTSPFLFTYFLASTEPACRLDPLDPEAAD